MNFLRYRWLYFLISALILLPGVFSLFRWGLRPSIDFTGGTLEELRIKNKDLRRGDQKEKLREIFAQEGLELSSIQETGEETLLLKTKVIDEAKNQEIMAKVKEQIGEVEQLRFETVGPILGKELVIKTLVGIALATIFILGYLAYQFRDKKYGICAVLAMFHDSFVLLGIFSLLGHFSGVEVDTLFVTALLTTLSFSVHDTVVVYDRIRESTRRFPGADFVDLVNKALTETMSRSVNNSLTIIFMLLSLYLLGGETIKWFIFALLVGTIAGTYSSPFVATPLLVVWQEWKEKKK